ncbi:serpentine type 7TM GPCR chemoreceptor srv domain-containing protein [Ditylenchus destructor]|uniref:Serpentine type 7TM GPCR chemoreceptor srv domain-containing protein n=1 Tax=Ditylenchus destructor TaxID=166010 RepID=A0AAD4R8Y9_9BILA|nr:serpentine type 7TM GPCR chemoreceptor srv domain-containing protein [Ditylenchus destructor]
MSSQFWLDAFSVVTKVVTAFSIVFSTPLYVSVMYFIIKRKHKMPYSSSFYSIFLALGVADLVSYYLYIFKKGSYWNWILPFFLPTNTPNLPATILYFLIWLFAFAQFQLNILISLNRFVSILMPDIYVKAWTTEFNRFIILLIYGDAAMGALPILWQKCIFSVISITGEGGENITKITGPVFQSPYIRDVYNTAWKVHIYLILLTCVVCYTIMFWKIRRLDLRDRNKKMAVEVRMFYTLLVLLIANVFYTIYFLTRDTLEHIFLDSGKYSEWSLYLLGDIYNMHNPYGLLITSREISRSVFPFKYFRWGKKKVATVAIVKSNNNCLTGQINTSSKNSSNSGNEKVTSNNL